MCIRDSGFDRVAPRAVVREDGEADSSLLEQVVAAQASLEAFATIVAEPELLAREERRRLLQVASAAWRVDPTGRQAFANVSRAAAADVQKRVGVIATGTVNLISEVGDLPVSVRNDLDQEMTAQLRLTPDGPSILLGDAVPVVVPAESESTIGVRVNAVGSADVEILAVLTDANGQVVGDAATLLVRVRADWENIGTAVIAAFVAAALILGLVRNIRRSPRRGDAVPPEAPPEEVART